MMVPGGGRQGLGCTCSFRTHKGSGAEIFSEEGQ